MSPVVTREVAGQLINISAQLHHNLAQLLELVIRKEDEQVQLQMSLQSAENQLTMLDLEGDQYQPLSVAEDVESREELTERQTACANSSEQLASFTESRGSFGNDAKEADHIGNVAVQVDTTTSDASDDEALPTCDDQHDDTKMDAADALSFISRPEDSEADSDVNNVVADDAAADRHIDVDAVDAQNVCVCGDDAEDKTAETEDDVKTTEPVN
jgi:hypothetical protein